MLNIYLLDGRAIVLGQEGWVLSQLAQPAETEEVDPLVMRSESARDYYRRVLTHMIFTQMSKCALFMRCHSEIVHHRMTEEFDDEAKCVSWTDFCDWAYHHRARIIDWPDNVDAPGPAFRFRELSTPHLRTLGQPYVDHIKDNADTRYPKIKPWTESE